MKTSRTIATLLLAMGLAVLAAAQSWTVAYERGLRQLQAGQWQAARASFREATTFRPEDFEGPTRIGGSVTDPIQWRGGAPYSPNLAAAYAGFRAAEGAADAARTAALAEVAAELATLLDKGQGGREAVWLLREIFDATRNLESRQALDTRVADGKANLAWRNDPDILVPEHRAAAGLTVAPAARPANQPAAAVDPAPVRPANQPAQAVDTPAEKPAATPVANPTAAPNPPANPTGDGGVRPTPRPPRTTPANPTGDRAPLIRAGNEDDLTRLTESATVVPVPTKFALVIGNSESRLDVAAPAFGASDALLFREALVQFAGYPEANVDLVVNASSAQILASAQALAERVPENATVVIYFTGVGANLEGKDYLAGIDTALATDTSTMVAKTDLFRLFMAKGARIFSFFQVDRPILAGRYFGMEIPMVGAISQMQGTIPGGSVTSIIRGGQPSGLFTESVAAVLREYRSNRIPIVEFAWGVFGRMQRGETGTTGGGSYQVPTLPVITNMASDARF